jgi:FKBP-type peptidyl-prolyl cis-trans isomerase FklB
LKTKVIMLTIVAVIVASGFAIGAKEATIKKKVAKTMKLETEMQKVSYAIGTNIGGQFRLQELDIQTEALIQGIKDALAGSDLALTKQEMNETMKEFGQKMEKKMREKQAKAGAENSKEGAAFLAENAKKPGVITLKSGLQYKVIKEGDGGKLKATDNFKAHYKGTLIDGTVFDSSEGGEPLVMAVTSVIPGWTEALQIMPIGSKWVLYVPGDLAYGSGPQGPGGPNSTLIFEIELLGAGEKK